MATSGNIGNFLIDVRVICTPRNTITLNKKHTMNYNCLTKDSIAFPTINQVEIFTKKPTVQKMELFVR